MRRREHTTGKRVAGRIIWVVILPLLDHLILSGTVVRRGTMKTMKLTEYIRTYGLIRGLSNFITDRLYHSH